MLTVMFQVAAADSGAVMEALAPIMCKVTDFSMEGTKDGATKRRVKRSPRGSKVKAIILEKLKEGPAGTLALGEALAAQGYKANSASPATSMLKREGKISWDHMRAQWSLAA